MTLRGRSMKIGEKIGAMSKKRIIIALVIMISIIIILLTIYLSSDYLYPLFMEPEVEVIDETYNASTINDAINSELSIFKAFEEEYGGEYSPELRRSIIENMKEQADSLGEDPGTFEKCIYANGELKDDDFHAIPCLAVKAKFEYYENYPGENPDPDDYPPGFDFGPKVSEPCWIFLINWGYEDENFGHIRVYIISIESQEQLYYLTCM
jgi:hypothetical protein